MQNKVSKNYRSKKHRKDIKQYMRLFKQDNKGGLSRKILAEYEELKKKYPNVK